jgi:hypothetical protein
MTAWLDDAPLPSRFDGLEDLDDFLTRPSRALAADLAALDGDIIVLGVGGKMGPTLARLARNAAPDKRVIGAARFSEAGLRDKLEACGVETIACDLLDGAALQQLPRLANVIFMAGRKFGAQDNAALTWAMNVHVPALVAEHFHASRIVAFSTGCVYPFVAIDSGGAGEDTPLGPQTIAVRWLAEEFGARLGNKARIFGAEAPTAWLTNTAQAVRLFGEPRITLATMIDWVAEWVAHERPSYNKPTRYEARDGVY